MPPCTKMIPRSWETIRYPMTHAVQLATQQQQQQQQTQHAIWSGILQHDDSLQSWVMVPIQAHFEHPQQPPFPAGFIMAILNWEQLLDHNHHVAVDSHTMLYSECDTPDKTMSTLAFRNGQFVGSPDSESLLRNNHPQWETTTLIHRQDVAATTENTSLSGLCTVRIHLVS